MVDSVYAQFLTCAISFAQRSRIGRISPSSACGPLWPWRAHEKPQHVGNMNLGFFERQHESAHGEEKFSAATDGLHDRPLEGDGFEFPVRERAPCAHLRPFTAQ